MNLNDIKLPTNRKFGFFFTLVFFIAWIYFYRSSSIIISYFLLSTSLLFITVTLLKPKLLLPLNRLWMQFGFLLGIIISPIVLGIIFFLLFTPMGFIMRLFSRDELSLKLIKSKTFWKIKKNEITQKDGFKHQF